MGISNKPIYDRATVGYRAAFFEGLSESTDAWRQFTFDVSHTGSEEVVIWASMDADMPEFKGQRQYVDVEFHQLDIKAIERLKGFRVPRKDQRSDRWMLYSGKARQLGRDVRIAENRLGFDFLKQGFAATYGLAYDGQLFFDTDHPRANGALQSNIQAGLLSATNYDSAYEKLFTLEQPDGTLANDGDVPTLLIVGQKNRSTATDILKLRKLESNPNFMQSELLVSGQLRDAFADYWYLVALHPDEETRPIWFKEEMTPEMVVQVDPNVGQVFEDNQARYGVNADSGFGYGRYETVVGSQG